MARVIQIPDEFQKLPSDPFALALRSLTSNPGAVRASAKVDITDKLTDAHETWVVDTFRIEGGKETVLLQRINADGGLRLVLPPEVTAVLSRQRSNATNVNRRRGAAKAVATRIARGDTLGNPTALAAARTAPRKARKARRRRARKA